MQWRGVASASAVVGPRESVVLRRFLPLCQRLLHNDVDGAAVFCMHAHQAAILRSHLQRFEDASIVEHEHAGIRHKQLETGHPFTHQIIHLRQLAARNVGDNAVKRVIGYCLTGRLAHPRVESLT